MKFKRVISIICAAALMTSACAFAEALKRDPFAKKQKERKRDNDVVFQEFKEVAEGSLPKGFSTSGTVYTQVMEVEGVKKNCLVLEDTSYDSTYGGSSFNYSVGTISGNRIGVEARYKFIDPKEIYSWLCFELHLRNSEGKIMTSVVVPSGASKTVMNNNHGYSFDNDAPLVINGWYTVSFVLDFEAGEADCMVKNETTGAVTAHTGIPFMNEIAKEDVAVVHADTAVNGGQYHFDYIRVSKDPDRIDPSVFETAIDKGMPVESMPEPKKELFSGKINVLVDGNAFYPTVIPRVEGGKVIMTAKNLANALGLSYWRVGDIFTLSKGESVLEIDAAAKTAKLGTRAVELTVAEKSGMQLLVSAEELAREFGFGFSFDEAAAKAEFTSASETPVQ